ncbi:MAG: NADPH:quinone reductase [Methylobacterium sp.]|nr:MAG: NADPH:quinone reductase [Methylobacterium sp.]
MKAVGYRHSLPIDHAESLLDLDLPRPEPDGRDLLVRVKAVSVNPVDFKVRLRAEPPAGEVKVLGFDASGIVEAVGPDCTLFKVGDAVWYAGDIRRPGTNAEFHLVDERIVGRKPASLDFAVAAALPLTTITAWELLFDRLEVKRQGGADASLLVIGGAGGVGSILIQLARRLTRLTVIATASRPESRDWCLKLGAHHVVNHTDEMAGAIKALDAAPVRYVAALTHTDRHWRAIAEIVAPQGKVALIDDPEPIDVRLLKQKSVSLHWELMFTRSMFETADMAAQGRLLGEAADLIDRGELVSTAAESLGTINAENLKRAHALLESGRTIGKITLAGF